MTCSPQQQARAATLLSLHHSGKLLMLPNVWNPIGARILEKQGYPAVATASAAVSAALGYADQERIRRSTLIDIIGRIARSVEVPVTADIESGYGATMSELEATIGVVIDAGIVGINLEDGWVRGGGLRSVDEQCARIAAVRQVAERRGLHLVINARVDSFMSGSFPSVEDAMEDAVPRAIAYAQAGADCIYPIGPGDEGTVRTLRQRIPAPLNILMTPDATPLSQLEAIGINRVSFGPYVFRACLRTFIDITQAVISDKDHAGIRNMLSMGEVAEYLHDDAE
jgi:2-methylisocitrate lyase-like PEP mutase family enzyme